MNRQMSEKERFVEIVRSFDDAMLVTRRSTGRLHARPMALLEIDDDGVVWFLTAEETPKAGEIGEHAQVAVVFQGDGRYASLSGVASLVHDRDRVRARWSERLRVWFPQGPDQSELVLVRVEPELGVSWRGRDEERRHLWPVRPGPTG